MAIVDDIAVAANGDIRWSGTTANYTVLELHRFLGDLADDEESTGDDFVDITRLTPSERSTDNIITLLGTYNIDDTVAQHLYAGSISQNSGADLYSGLRVLGAVNNTDTEIQIVQDNALYAPVFWGDQSTGGYNGDTVAGVLMEVMIKSRSGGTDIDGKRIRCQIRHWGDTYDFFNVTLGQGVAVAALGSTPDAQNTTAQSAVTIYSSVTNTEGYQLIDLNNGNGPEPYYSQWTFGADDNGDGLKSIWEYGKDLTGNGTAKTIHGINGELFLGITHSYSYNTETGNPFIENDIMTWGAGLTAGTGLLLALDDQGATGNVYFQLLTGIAPTNGLTINNEAADGTHDTVAVESKTVPKIFLGSYTGTLIGAYGIGVASSDLTSVDTIQDLLGVTQTPPNNVTFTVSALEPGEDRVLVGPRTGTILQLDQMAANSTVSAGAATVQMQAAIPIDTPAAGTFRLLGDGGVYNLIKYSSYAGDTFTLSGATTTPDDVTAGANAFVSYIDKDVESANEAFTTIYDANRLLFVRVRDGGGTPIKTYEAQATLTSTGGSSVASRITDE